MTSKSYDQQRSAIICRLLKKGGFRGRIEAKCCDCIYDPLADGTWRKQVENCTCFHCPLYEVRPGSCKLTARENSRVSKEAPI